MHRSMLNYQPIRPKAPGKAIGPKVPGKAIRPKVPGKAIRPKAAAGAFSTRTVRRPRAVVALAIINFGIGNSNRHVGSREYCGCQRTSGRKYRLLF